MNYSDYILEMILLENNKANRKRVNDWKSRIGYKYYEDKEPSKNIEYDENDNRLYFKPGGRQFARKNHLSKDGSLIKGNDYNNSNVKIKEKDGKIYYIYPSNVRINKKGKRTYIPGKIVVKDKETNTKIAEFSSTNSGTPRKFKKFNSENVSSAPTPTETKQVVAAAVNVATAQGGTSEQQQNNAETMAKEKAQQDAKKDAQSTPKPETPKTPVASAPTPTKSEAEKAATLAADAAKAQGGTAEQQQQTAQAVAKAQGKQKAKMSTKKKIGIGAVGAAGVAGLAIGGKLLYDRIQYNKFKKKNPNVSYKQWKAMRKKSLNESFNEGYQAALEEFYY